jgi:AraC-like DNA-binding protein
VDISRQAWSQSTSDAAAWARAGGRRRHNATRRAHAELRRAEVARLLGTLGWRHGTQAVIARHLGVSEATISRDFTALFRSSPPRRCPLCGCGCAALTDLDGTP